MNKLTFRQYLKINKIWMLIGLHIVMLIFWLYGYFVFDDRDESRNELIIIAITLGIVDTVWLLGSAIVYRKLH